MSKYPLIPRHEIWAAGADGARQQLVRLALLPLVDDPAADDRHVDLQVAESRRLHGKGVSPKD